MLLPFFLPKFLLPLIFHHSLSQLFVDIAVPVAVDKLFTYLVPTELHEVVQRGKRIVAPFGKRTIVGIIANISHQSSIRGLKSIHDVLDAEPVISTEQFRLAEWIAEYYFAPLGEVLKSMLVQGALSSGKRIVKFTNVNVSSPLLVTKNQREILDILSKSPMMSVPQLQKKVGLKSVYSTLNILARNGYVVITEEAPKYSLKPKYESVVEINEEWKQLWREWAEKFASQTTNRNAARQAIILRELLSVEVPAILLQQFLKQTKCSLSTVKTLAAKKLLALVKREVIRAQEYDLHESSLGTQNIVLNSHQQQALNQICAALDTNNFCAFLLHGITGSGKTQVYIEAIRETLSHGKTAIVLVPEISLTPQIVRRFKFHFGDSVVAFHSKMSQGERYDAWRLAREGKCSIVIGPRSAIFAPLKNVGLIVIDEEQESSYKQFDTTPRYHARDVAVMRANYSNAVVVLGSATPSFESYTNALNKKYGLLELPERVDNAQLPQVEIVDMTVERRKGLEIFREERKKEYKVDPVKAQLSKRKFEFDSISDLLKEKIEDRLKKNEGIIVLQNRRGFAPFIECPDCGYVEMCNNCNITLTYHLGKRHLRCHYCGLVKQPTSICPTCNSFDIQYRGFGTQRVEDDLKKIFPDAILLRMDLDTTTQKGSHDKMLKQFAEGKANILLGTQMVAKGLDFSRVTLVGVISADTQMLLPDFRSAERTFQLLTQVAGRAGRSSLAGEVVIQTFQSQHYSLKHVLSHDFKSFYEEELAHRKELDYPPFSRLVLLEFKGKNENEVVQHANQFAESLKKHDGHFLTLGPAPATISRVKNLYRWHIVIKDLKSLDPSGKNMHRALHEATKVYRSSQHGRSSSVQLVIDTDPVGMM